MLRKILVCCALITSFQAAQAAEYTLSVQPMMAPEKARAFFKPLADYLSAKTGETIKLKTYRSFKSYWSHMKRDKEFDLVLDGAHFVDYRIKQHNHKVLVKLPDTVSFTVATGQDLLLIDIEELIPLKVASMIVPGMGGLRLKEMFPDPANRPTIILSYDAEDVVRHIRKGDAAAGIIPTPIMERYPDLNSMVVTDPVPHQGFTVSPRVPDALAKKIKKILMGASKTQEGKKVLSAINVNAFVPATNEIYDGYSSLLDIMRRP